MLGVLEEMRTEVRLELGNGVAREERLASAATPWPKRVTKTGRSIAG
jgi:hypothetical protein